MIGSPADPPIIAMILGQSAIPAGGANMDQLPPISGGRSSRYGRGSGPIVLLVIDRRSLTRDCLVAALTEHPLIADITSASDPEAAAGLGRAHMADVALLNLGSDPFDEDGLSYLRARLTPLLPAGQIAIMTSLGDETHMLSALRGGVTGYLLSEMPLEVVGNALHLVGLGWTVYPSLRQIASVATLGVANDAKTLDELRLSNRQREVLDALRQGMTNRSIGAQLGISERAIKAHVQELMRRLNVSNRTQIVAKLAGLRSGDRR